MHFLFWFPGIEFRLYTAATGIIELKIVKRIRDDKKTYIQTVEKDENSDKQKSNKSQDEFTDR